MYTVSDIVLLTLYIILPELTSYLQLSVISGREIPIKLVEGLIRFCLIDILFGWSSHTYNVLAFSLNLRMEYTYGIPLFLRNLTKIASFSVFLNTRLF